MKHSLFFTIHLLLLALAVSGCKTAKDQSNLQSSNSSPQPVATSLPETKELTNSPNVQPLDKGVILNFSLEASGGRKPKIVGDTNLPDGTELMFSIEGQSVGYKGQDKGVVQGRRFQSNTFGKDLKDLDAGQYSAEVLMPVSLVQPSAVRTVIGDKGQNLKGPLVENGDLGATVSLKRAFQLKADGTVSFTQNKSEIADAKKNVQAVFDALKQLEQQGRGMESLRKNKITDNIRQCGALMLERQTIADDLRSKAASLLQPYSVLLSSAATELKLCVSCASFAIKNCNQGKSWLDMAAKEMR